MVQFAIKAPTKSGVGHFQNGRDLPWPNRPQKEITLHDVQSTFTKLAHQGRAPLEQFQHSLGYGALAHVGRIA